MTASTFGRELKVRGVPATVWTTSTDVRRVVSRISVVEGAEEPEPQCRYTCSDLAGELSTP